MDAVKYQGGKKPNEAMFNRQVARSQVKIGNWFEEQEYWDALEARDGEMWSASSIIADPTVDARKMFTTSNSVYGSGIKDEDVKLDNRYTKKAREFNNTEKISQKATHQIIPDEYPTFKQQGTRDHRPDIIPPCNFEYDVTMHQTGLSK